MKTKTILCMALALSAAFPSNAQTARQLIEQDITRIGCTLHHYEPMSTADTKAPKGYKPFYVSHFGRHGSRSHGGASSYDAVKLLDSLGTLGLLTTEGQLLRAQMDSLVAIHADMYGFLTQVGSREHQEIAARLYERCPEIFNQKERNEVLAVSSTVVRCIQSMANFCTTLESKSPDLKFSYYTNGRTDKALTRVDKGRPVLPETCQSGSDALDSIKHAVIKVDRMASAFFTDPERALKIIPDAQFFFYDIINGGVVEQCLDEKAPKIYSHFTTDELYNFWLCCNARALNSHGFCYENREASARRGQYILRDILNKADEAMLPGSHKAADLRFSHDGQTLPFIFFLGLEGCDGLYHLGDEVNHGWYAFQNICMGTNVQMIFYRNSKGDVLVKFLHNEKEKKLSGLEPFQGPYYKWSELRPYLEKLTDVNLEK